jgi:hypothetical protein
MATGSSRFRQPGGAFGLIHWRLQPDWRANLARHLRAKVRVEMGPRRRGERTLVRQQNYVSRPMDAASLRICSTSSGGTSMSP